MTNSVPEQFRFPRTPNGVRGGGTETATFDLGVSASDEDAYRKVLRRDPCAYCANRRPDGKVLNDLEHVVPRSSGGPDVPENWSTACPTCNSSKGDQPLLFWLATRSTRSIKGVVEARSNGGSERRTVEVRLTANDFAIVLSAGTTKNVRKRGSALLSPEAARDVAGLLLEAADAAEARMPG